MQSSANYRPFHSLLLLARYCCLNVTDCGCTGSLKNALKLLSMQCLANIAVLLCDDCIVGVRNFRLMFTGQACYEVVAGSAESLRHVVILLFQCYTMWLGSDGTCDWWLPVNHVCMCYSGKPMMQHLCMVSCSICLYEGTNQRCFQLAGIQDTALCIIMHRLMWAQSVMLKILLCRHNS